MNDYDLNIHSNPDAMAWSKLFVETTKDWDRDLFRDEELMMSWFANAMMAMYDHLMGTGPINGDHLQWLIDSAALREKK